MGVKILIFMLSYIMTKDEIAILRKILLSIESAESYTYKLTVPNFSSEGQKSMILAEIKYSKNTLKVLYKTQQSMQKENHEITS